MVVFFTAGTRLSGTAYFFIHIPRILADYYAQFGKVAKVKGEGSKEDIFGSLVAKIEAKQPA